MKKGRVERIQKETFECKRKPRHQVWCLSETRILCTMCVNMWTETLVCACLHALTLVCGLRITRNSLIPFYSWWGPGMLNFDSLLILFVFNDNSYGNIVVNLSVGHFKEWASHSHWTLSDFMSRKKPTTGNCRNITQSQILLLKMKTIRAGRIVGRGKHEAVL